MSLHDAALTILLVDDDSVDRMAVRRALAASDLQVEVDEAPNAATASGAIHARSFDCILLDYRLPDRDGIHLLRQLRHEGIQTPVVMLTGHGDELLAVELMKAGASDYIPKNQMTPSGLALSIRHAVRIHRLELEASRAASVHAQQLRGLADAAVELSSTRSAGALLERAASRARGVLLADVAEARLAIAAPDDPGGTPGDVKVARLATRLTAPIRARRADLDPDLVDAIAAAGLATPTTCWLAAPLVDATGTPIGLIHACDKPNRGFTEDDEAMLVQLAQMTSSSLQNGALLAAAERAAKARDEMMSVVSHDLRNPLNTISMGLSMLERSGTAAVESGVVTRMRRATTRLDRIIGDLLDVTRIDAGTLVVDRAPVAPAGVVDEVVDLLGAQAAAKQVGLVADVPPHGPAVLADRDRLMQVLMNVVGNAIKFTPEGGLVMVAVERHGDAVRFEVRDTGPGISAEDLPHVFDRFWQARSTARMGTGLGLCIARGIAEAHGGSMSIESTEGLGTIVSVSLPTATEPAPAHRGDTNLRHAVSA